MQAQLKKVSLAVFASGSGSNAEAIINHFRQHEWVSVKVVITNKENAGVIDRAKRLKVPFEIITKSDFNHSKRDQALDDLGIDWIVLAGWLLLVLIHRDSIR
jgi:Folate-dependent phosphoribosylglycinamide formyltransferase PurN